ncbi:MAG: anthranilate phosphoribosyltransferase [Deltaproteobacteria bacterium]|nr:anthranilate phosphoribosyltransferase [Deltaproteobacteria bacterium]
MTDMKATLALLETRRNLTRGQAAAAMELMIRGMASDDETKALLLALREKGATADEIAGFAHVMRAHGLPVNTSRTELIDVCGTGGDGAGTFNISTTVAFVIAGAGVNVAKHGNRSVSSQCGSSDVLEALGLRADLTPQAVVHSLNETGLGFFFAPTFHPALKRFAQLRRELKVRTVFNVLGPLANPAGARRQVVGVFDGALTEVMAYTLRELGSEEAMVVSGEDGLDELTLTGRTRVAHLKNGKVTSYTLTPQDAGLPNAPIQALSGGDAKQNAKILRALLAGEKGPKRDAVLYNSAAALLVAGRAATLPEGVKLAARSIDQGNALAVLTALQTLNGKADK